MFAIALTGILPALGSNSASAQIVIAEQGSFFVGGEVIYTETGNDGQAVSNFNPGHARIN